MIVQGDAGGEAAYSSSIMVKQLWTSLKQPNGRHHVKKRIFMHWTDHTKLLGNHWPTRFIIRGLFWHVNCNIYYKASSAVIEREIWWLQSVLSTQGQTHNQPARTLFQYKIRYVCMKKINLEKNIYCTSSTKSIFSKKVLIRYCATLDRIIKHISFQAANSKNVRLFVYVDVSGLA